MKPQRALLSIVVSLLLLLPAAPALAGVYTDEEAQYNYNLEPLASLRGKVNDMVPSGSWIFLAQANYLRVFDNHDPARPRLAASLRCDWLLEQLVLAPPALYVASREFSSHWGKFFLIDITDPLHPMLSHHQFDMGISRVPKMKKVNGRLYLRGHDWGEMAYDIKDPLMPVELPEVRVSRSDFSDRQTTISLPASIGGMECFAEADQVKVNDRRVYVHDEREGWKAVDPSDPVNPKVLDEHVLVSLTHPARSDDSATLTQARLAIQKIYQAGKDIPIKGPLPADHVTIQKLLSHNQFVAAQAEVNGSTYLNVFDVSQPANPSVILSIKDKCDGLEYNENFFLSDHYLLLDHIDRNSQTFYHILQIYDLTHPESLQSPIASCDTLVQINDAAVSGNLVYVADGANGLVILRMKQPSTTEKK